MVELRLTDRERELLVEILSSDLSDLRAEIAQTERAAFRAMLKERRDMLQRMLETLEAPAPMAG